MENKLQLVNQKTAYHVCAEIASVSRDLHTESVIEYKKNKKGFNHISKSGQTTLSAINTMIKLADLELKRAALEAKYGHIKFRELESKPFDNTI